MSGKGHGGLYKAPTKEERRGRLRGERDHIEFIDLRFTVFAHISFSVVGSE